MLIILCCIPVEAMNDTVLAAFLNGSDFWGGEC